MAIVQVEGYEGYSLLTFHNSVLTASILVSYIRSIRRPKIIAICYMFLSFISKAVGTTTGVDTNGCPLARGKYKKNVWAS
jgi:hypothetical protein